MRKRIFVAFGAAALWFAVPVMAANIFQFNGITLGMSLTDLRAKFPNLVCDDEAPQISTCSEEHGSGDTAEVYVFNMYSGKVARANIWFSGTKYREAKETLIHQLGRPSNKMDTEVEKKKVEVLTWMRSSPSGLIVLEQAIANDPSKTNLMMNDDTLVGEMAKAK
jgi:hypothetical protein